MSDEFNYSHEDPFYVFSLSDDAIDNLNEYCKNIPDDGWSNHQIDFDDPVWGETRKDFRLCDIHCPTADSIVATLGGSMFEIMNNKHYQFDVQLFEFQILKYGVGGNFHWHCDYGVAPNKDVWRKLSLSVQLSGPEDYEGGDLIIVDYYNQHCQIPKAKGACVVFDSRCPHKAEPVTKGERFVLVGWASGPKLK